ncbi:MAG TPA: DNA recombination protein RmuC [Actinomycetota bacterium]|nr:DNA recombination protein RmuC [Actinomycetota bacterium]
MHTAVIALAALAVGACLSLALVQVVRPAGRRDRRDDPRGIERLLEAQSAELRRLCDADARRDLGGERLRDEVASFRESLSVLQAREQERRAREEQGWETLQRVSSVLAGGQRSGRAGENVLRESLGALPPAMMVTDFRVNGRVVEFGLVLPDGRRLPVDSKWTAERELRALAECEDPEERERLSRAVERAVTERAREVSGYRDPAVTCPFGVAAVPDGAYEVLRRAHAEAYRHGVIVVSYSMALPVLLFLYGIVARLGGQADLEACLADLVGILDSVETTLENKVVRATTMLVNGTDELRGQIGKARGMLARAPDGGSGLEPPPPALSVVEASAVAP